MSEEKPLDPSVEPEPPPAPAWEYRKEFGAVRALRALIRQTIQATEAELVVLRQKLEKQTYGG